MAIFAKIMYQQHKGKLKYILILTLAMIVATVSLYSNNKSLPFHYFHNNLTNDTTLKKKKPSLNVLKDSTIINTKALSKNKSFDSLNKKIVDTPPIVVVDTLRFKTSKDSLDAPVTYHADDSMVLDMPKKKILLYGKKTTVQYQDNNLESPFIEFDQSTNYVSAYFVKDSAGKVLSYPTFKQGDLTTVSDSIKYNMKTSKGITKSAYTKEGEMFVHGEVIKKNNATTISAYRASFTTCNLDTPHFAFVSNKIKIINKKMVYTGPIHPEIEGIPLPITLPFGIFPLSQGRHSGLLAPTFTVNANYGLALDGLGFYKIINQNWDAVFRGTIYSYGGWTAEISPRYFKRYHYQGSFNLSIQHYRDLDNAGNRGFNIRWNHSSDSKARPGVTFNSNVNAGSSKFNSAVPNNPTLALTNTLNSSITYSKVWKDKPFNLTVSANHDQNTVTKLINLHLPDVAFTLNTLYPFRKTESVGTYKWFENIGVGLTSNVKGLTNFYDTAGHIGKQMLNNFQWGGTNAIPISLSLPPIGSLQVAPSISFSENWYQNKLVQTWDSTAKKIDSNVTKGFYEGRDMSFGVSATSRIFGMIGFNKNSKIQTIRHEIRPTIGFSYHPDLSSKNFYSVQVDTFKTIRRQSLYSGNIAGIFNEGQTGAITFGVDNILQMKVKDKKDTSAQLKKVTLIDGLSINGSYDLLKDSFNFSAFNISAHTNLFDKINISVSGQTYPYQIDSTGKFINKTIWSKKPISLGKLTFGSISLSTSFKGGDKKEKLPNNSLTNPSNQMISNSGLPLDEYQQEAALINKNPGDYVNFNIPWSISFSYSLNYNFVQNSRHTGDTSVISQNLSLNATLNLTSKWQLGGSGFYDISKGQLSGVNLNISREMHCWQMTISMSPIGSYKYFNISIHPKSAMLRDLKINRTRNFYDL